MSLVDRAKNILLKPAEEWPEIAAEGGDIIGLFRNYACILALIPLAVGVLASLLVGAVLSSAMGGMAGSAGFAALLVSQVVSYVLGLAVLFGISFAVSAISPSFNGKQDLFQSTKLVLYSTTPIWLACLFLIVPLLNLLIIFGAVAYAIYLFYLGAKPVLGIPNEKVAGFTVVTMLVYIVIGVVFLLIQSAMSFGSPAVM